MANGARASRLETLAKIGEGGGWEVIFTRISDGETLDHIAGTLGCSRALLVRYLNERPARRERLKAALTESASAITEQTADMLAAVPANGPAVAKARALAGHQRWRASVLDREVFGAAVPPDTDLGQVFVLALQAVDAKMTARTATPALPAPALELMPGEIVQTEDTP